MPAPARHQNLILKNKSATVDGVAQVQENTRIA